MTIKILFALIIFLLVIFIIFKSINYSPQIKDAAGNRIANSISEIRKVKIGNLTQTILIRGENFNNPVLLYLHGGPGTTELIPFRLFHKNLEKYFTIIAWEQRGTGKSFSTEIPENTMTINQFVADAHELTTYLIKEFQKKKILVVGHSWGTALGLLLVQKYPEQYYAYVGSGQEVNPKEGEKISYQYLIERAKGNQKALDELLPLNSVEQYLTIDKSDNWYEKIKIHRKWLIRLGGEIYNQTDYSLLFNMKTIIAPEYSLMDFINFGRGSVFSLKTMWPQIMKLNLTQEIPQINIPVYILQGRHDYNTPSVLVEDYFNKLISPNKNLIWFENSGHHPAYEEPEKYDNILIDKVLPLCKE
ncbi:MAG: alpha/beta hydrolase [Bacteroidota bacterium]